MPHLPETSVLFIDLQEDFLDTSRTQPPADLRRAAGALRDIAELLAYPCYAAILPGGPQGMIPLIAELQGGSTPVPTIPRTTISALSAVTITTPGVILAGIAMEGAILHTALAARAEGLAVHVALDASGGLSTRTEDAAIRQLHAAGAVSTSVASLATAWIGGFGDAVSYRVLQILRGLITPA